VLAQRRREGIEPLDEESWAGSRSIAPEAASAS
jgi:hypothetical protein